MLYIAQNNQKWESGINYTWKKYKVQINTES